MTVAGPPSSKHSSHPETLSGKPKIKKGESEHSGQSFEESLHRLEEIVEKIEQGRMSLDEVMKMYEEGVRLSKSCLDHLSQAEIKLKRLNKDIAGNFELFDEKVPE